MKKINNNALLNYQGGDREYQHALSCTFAVTTLILGAVTAPVSFGASLALIGVSYAGIAVCAGTSPISSKSR
jgi:hypothetical protein